VYARHRIKTIYYSLLYLPLDDGFIAIMVNDQVLELIGIIEKQNYVE